jgi:cytoskeletal protein RodZ
MNSHISRYLAVLLALSIAGMTDVAQAWQTATPAQNAHQQNNVQQATPAATNSNPQDQTAKPVPDASQKGENNASDPNYVPPATDVLPNAPSLESQNPQATQGQNGAQQPLGTAAAKEANTVGGAASKPAGTALAGVKQKQSRGLLIKVGAVLAAGAALGTVYALSRSTSPTPPGAVR